MRADLFLQQVQQHMQAVVAPQEAARELRGVRHAAQQADRHLAQLLLQRVGFPLVGAQVRQAHEVRHQPRLGCPLLPQAADFAQVVQRMQRLQLHWQGERSLEVLAQGLDRPCLLYFTYALSALRGLNVS